MATDIAITTLSSKGQIVIPETFRKSWRKGDKILLIRDGERIAMTLATKTMQKFAGDIEFAKRTAEAWERYERGEFVSMSEDEFRRWLEKR